MTLWKFTDKIAHFFPEKISKRSFPNGNISFKVITTPSIVDHMIIADIDGIMFVQASINTENITFLDTPITFCVFIE